jgi:protein-S-isoprenylcysteine O-methyltransferase Ste14
MKNIDNVILVRLMKNNILNKVLTDYIVWLIFLLSGTLYAGLLLVLNKLQTFQAIQQITPLLWLRITALLSITIFALVAYLIIFYKKQNVKINSQTCNWIQDPGIWKHKITNLHYCPHCAPNPSPLSTYNNESWFCHKCEHGFGEGEAFTIED